MNNTKLSPLEIMEFEDHDYRKDMGGSEKDIIEYIIKTSTDDTNLYKCLKANIICSRRKYEEVNSVNYHKWDIDLFRDIITSNYHLILFNLNLRWKVSILECFTFDGTHDEQLISSLIAQLHHSTLVLQPLIRLMKNPHTIDDIHELMNTHGLSGSDFTPDSKDIIRLIIRIKSIIPKCKYIGLLALDILRELHRDEFSIFAFVTKVKNYKMQEYINYILHSNEFDSKELYRIGDTERYR